MADPVSAQDGFTYERAAIEEWFTTRDVSPQLGTQLESKELTPNGTRRVAIEQFLALRLRANSVEGAGTGASDTKAVTIEWEAHGMQPATESRRIPSAPTTTASAEEEGANMPALPSRASNDMSAAMSKVFMYLDPLRDLLAQVGRAPSTQANCLNS
jgi:hypothetical protein